MADNKNVIPNGLTASKIRNRMEDKNTLVQKGSMYAGTGVMGENGAAVTTFTPPPSENTLLVKDDTQDGGLGWKNVGNVIGGALNARQDIMANYIYTDQNSIFISHRTDPERNYTMSVNSRTFYGTGPAPSIIPCSKFVFYNGDGAGTKTDIEAKNFIGNLTGNADSASYANYANYASSDTSKGTIEDRLTNLGFNRVPLEIINLPYTGTLTSSSLELLKEGNFLKLNLSFAISGEATEKNCIGNLVSHSSDISYNQQYTKPDFIPSNKTFTFLGAMYGMEDRAIAIGQSVTLPFSTDTNFILTTDESTMTLKFEYHEDISTSNIWIKSIKCQDIQTYSPNM